jgi:hypothetical protein
MTVAAIGTFAGHIIVFLNPLSRYAKKVRNTLPRRPRMIAICRAVAPIGVRFPGGLADLHARSLNSSMLLLLVIQKLWLRPKRGGESPTLRHGCWLVPEDMDTMAATVYLIRGHGNPAITRFSASAKSTEAD